MQEARCPIDRVGMERFKRALELGCVHNGEESGMQRAGMHVSPVVRPSSLAVGRFSPVTTQIDRARRREWHPVVGSRSYIGPSMAARIEARLTGTRI